MLTTNKVLRGILKQAETEGWAFSRHRRHIKGAHQSGRTTTISVSPSDYRGIKNIQRDLRIGAAK